MNSAGCALEITLFRLVVEWRLELRGGPAFYAPYRPLSADDTIIHTTYPNGWRISTIFDGFRRELERHPRRWGLEP